MQIIQHIKAFISGMMGKPYYKHHNVIRTENTIPVFSGKAHMRPLKFQKSESYCFDAEKCRAGIAELEHIQPKRKYKKRKPK